ncbi:MULTISPECIES: helix-turn-helix domain-containing protein [unclassified Tolypothrix]|uniref:helix-turn-helix domain-containing protein n=1 Tax=unclassified Tolypothrix TaxID=2649714 RepID=UPI0005EAA7A9|nr:MULTISPECIES: AraC family transcriptional regulator [unclassified Tolypothrix]BAY95886.1 transcriptional regulator [Microchaete diplosiphon NIES-3275]EKE96810.1 putative AraC family transcrptional regulator [Tolypothrix sp. PCC 7601]MBE9083912.1 helix-turn-helix transcriptional regulator [Tolypothrix sp. LEGE 11397]UYD30978.1 helix-turn-helix transcriptional regulator [Tolypothrix sp. PCC 7712]UYD38830.1 helix-turn-helix transcriptional regulator [Tolypothrix sp. PCC 7601]
MSNILLIDEPPATKKLLMKCLETGGFEVIITENGLVNVQLVHQKFSTTTESKKTNTQKSIFPSIPRLREVFEFIELNYHQSIRLKEVAQAVGYSSAYLTDLVRRLTGKTVNNWIIERRLAAASTLLLETNYSVDEIALKIGYQNINHFYCQFRDYYKNTPCGWRKIQHCKQGQNQILQPALEDIAS